VTVVALDGMGGDFAPQATVAGALRAAASGVEVALVGDSQVLGAELNRIGAVPERLRIVHAPDVIEMDAPAATEARRRRESSIYVATEMVQRGAAQAVVSMGNTGAAMAVGLLVLGRLKGVERPALGAVLPAPGGPTLVLDVGANADARPAHLVQFARLGSAYMHSVYGIAEPRIGLLSIGEEASKGSSLIVESNERLQAESGLRFSGNVEGRDLLAGTVDVVVTDGFTGNVAIKLMEGTVSMMFEQMRLVARQSLRARAGGALLLPALRGMRTRFDYRQYGGVPLLGVQGGVFIGHGRSDAEAVANAVRTAAAVMEQGLVEALSGAIQPAG
jgi:glycerol-3-phosphate acyltransferase PlsX